MKSFKKYLSYILAFVILFMNTTSSALAEGDSNTQDNIDTEQQTEADSDWPEYPTITSESAVVMDASTGLILYEKNSHKRQYPASTTKIMTSLLAIENAALSETVTFSRDAIFNIDKDSSRTGIDVGEELTLEQSLYCILLDSANEVSYAVAEHVGGTYDNFVAMMNEKAQELGLQDTHFENPHGLYDDNHYTTAYDMALIAQAAIKNTTFAKITGARTYQIPPTNIQSETRYIANHHLFIKKDLNYEGVIGGKTGYTQKARYSLVTYAKRGDMELIAVIMKCDNAKDQYTDTAKLLDYGFDNFSIYNISDLESEQAFDGSLFTKYNKFLNEDSSLLTTGSGYLVLPNTVSYEDAQKEITFTPISNLQEGENVIGTISYTYDGKLVGSTDIIYNNVPMNSLTESDSIKIIKEYTNGSSEASKLSGKKNLKPIIIVSIVGVILLLFFLYYIFIERPRIRRRKAYYKKRRLHRLYSEKDLFD